MKKPSKYRARRTEVDGITFASKKEAKRYSELKLLERAGEIQNLELQPRFELQASGGAPLGAYVADFRFYERRQHVNVFHEVVEDVKGFKTPLYRWKKKHVEAQYGITIREI
jgi:hypothetical protein